MFIIFQNNTDNSSVVNSLWVSDTIWRQIWVNFGSGNDLLPAGTKLLPEQCYIFNRILWHLLKTNLTSPRYQFMKWVWKIPMLNYYHISQGLVRQYFLSVYCFIPGALWALPEPPPLPWDPATRVGSPAETATSVSRAETVTSVSRAEVGKNASPALAARLPRHLRLRK